MDKPCVQECPADCIYEGARSLYINPHERVDCGACRLVWHVEDDRMGDRSARRRALAHNDNAAFFQTVLPGVDTPLVEAMPAKPPSNR
jgi:Fe-S-cluster-containing hydrogenase component 2